MSICLIPKQLVQSILTISTSSSTVVQSWRHPDRQWSVLHSPTWPSDIQLLQARTVHLLFLYVLHYASPLLLLGLLAPLLPQYQLSTTTSSIPTLQQHRMAHSLLSRNTFRATPLMHAPHNSLALRPIFIAEAVLHQRYGMLIQMLTSIHTARMHRRYHMHRWFKTLSIILQLSDKMHITTWAR